MLRKALVIEDDANVRENIIDLLSEEGFDPVGAENGRVGLAALHRDRPALILCDIRMPEVDGFEVLAKVRADPETRTIPFIFLSAAADRADVRTGMNLGADDYLTKPFTRAELLEAIRSRLERREILAAQATAAVPGSTAITAPKHPQRLDSGIFFEGSDSVVLCDPAMRVLYEQAARAAAATISVLVLGETGVGKEILAHSIHKLSPRREKPFLALNCAAISESLLEGELFGNERGAFTGAHAARQGLFEAAEGGTVFLDEVGELPMSIQVKLLRVLEERRVMRVGGRVTIPIDVRFVAATNRDLETCSEQGTFRQDLYFRLNGISLTIPPLRERRSEIVPLAEKFIRMTAEKMGHKSYPRLSDDATDLLQRYSWPGNIRELRNVIDRALVLSWGDSIVPEHFPPKLRAAPVTATSGPTPGPLASSLASSPSSSAGSSPSSPVSSPIAGAMAEVDSPSRRLRLEMEALERNRIIEALERCGGNQTAAADMLGISRRTLVTRLDTYDLPRPRKR
jgi:two-component system response regulator AtoC